MKPKNDGRPTEPAKLYEPFMWKCNACEAPIVAAERSPDGLSICRAGHRMKHSDRRSMNPVPASSHVKYPTPTEPGYYWAKWRLAEDGSQTKRNDDPDQPWNGDWEPVKVVANHIDYKNDPEDGLYVDVADEPVVQKIGNFIWGPKIEPPK